MWTGYAILVSKFLFVLLSIVFGCGAVQLQFSVFLSFSSCNLHMYRWWIFWEEFKHFLDADTEKAKEEESRVWVLWRRLHRLVTGYLWHTVIPISRYFWTEPALLRFSKARDTPTLMQKVSLWFLDPLWDARIEAESTWTCSHRISHWFLWLHFFTTVVICCGRRRGGRGWSKTRPQSCFILCGFIIF